MSNKHIYDKVNRLVRKYKTRDPKTLIEALGIKIIYLNSPDKLLGLYKIILRNRFIFIADNIGVLEKTVLAHELGHDQLHREYCINGANFHESRVFQSTSRFELEANIFAAHLLIPDEDVIQLIQYASSDRELAHELNVDINLLNLKISEMAKMNLLNVNQSRILVPDSQFLKKYRPIEEC